MATSGPLPNLSRQLACCLRPICVLCELAWQLDTGFSLACGPVVRCSRLPSWLCCARISSHLDARQMPNRWFQLDFVEQLLYALLAILVVCETRVIFDCCFRRKAFLAWPTTFCVFVKQAFHLFLKMVHPLFWLVFGCGSKPMVPCWSGFTTHLSLF